MGPFERLNENIEKLQDLSFKTELDIEKFMMPDEEIAKNIIRIATPELTDEQINLMVESPAKLKGKIDNSLSEEEKQRRKEQIEANHQIFKNKKKEMKKKAKEKKKEIKIAFYNLIREIKALIKKMITSLIQAVSSIAAIAVVIAAPPWNIPLAISYCMAIVDIILTLVSQIKAIMPFTPALQELNLVCAPKNLATLANIINAFIVLILGIQQKVNILDAIISALLAFIIPLLSGGNGKQKNLNNNSKRLRDLGHFSALDGNSEKRFNVDGQSIRANDQESAEEIKSILDRFKVDYNSQSCSDFKDPAMNDVMNGTLLKQLQDSLTKSDDDLVKEAGVESYEVYDVKLPDGRILTEQTQDDLKLLERVYTLVYEGISDLTEKAKLMAEDQEAGNYDE